MKRTIKVGENDIELEANLGTADLFEILTGENLFEKLAEYRNIKGTDPKSYALIAIYKKMMFVMNAQATTKEIPEVRGKMNIDNYLLWTSQFELTDINADVIAEVVKLWNDNRKTHSQPKNQ